MAIITDNQKVPNWLKAIKKDERKLFDDRIFIFIEMLQSYASVLKLQYTLIHRREQTQSKHWITLIELCFKTNPDGNHKCIILSALTTNCLCWPIIRLCHSPTQYACLLWFFPLGVRSISLHFQHFPSWLHATFKTK